MTPGKRRVRRRTAKTDGPDPIDLHVGRQVRLARERAGLTQAAVGKELGMSFQVVQKYEQGEIRISASRLLQLARLLAEPVGAFFATLAGEPAVEADPTALGAHELELVQAFRRIANEEVQQRLLQLVRGMAGRGPAGPEPGAETVPGAKGRAAK